MSLPIIQDKFDIEIKIGKDSIKARKWKGKDRLRIQEIYFDELDTDDALKSLIIENLEDRYKKKYFSTAELMYIAINIREASISPDVEFSFECDRRPTEDPAGFFPVPDTGSFHRNKEPMPFPEDQDKGR